MAGDGAFVPAFRISTADLPEKDRVSIWIEEYSRVFFKAEMEPIADIPFHQSAHFYQLPGLGLCVGESTGCLTRRASRHIAEGEGGFGLAILSRGHSNWSQFGVDVSSKEACAVLVSQEDPGSWLLHPANNEMMILVLSRQALTDRMARPEEILSKAIPLTSEPLRLLTGYLKAFQQANPALWEPSLRQAYSTHIHDLIALALAPHRETQDRAKEGLKAARLHAIKADIKAHLEQPDLSVSTVAARQGLSPRYIQKLFEAEGATYSAFLLEERLVLAHKRLCNPECATKAISQIAYDCGFIDLSHFNRRFRKRYGMTPSDVRAAGINKRQRCEK
jgi:AraC-like DNA-binding protein